jgi:ubiquitin-conjugating enzyme (huntingtin interacting protein 2)
MSTPRNRRISKEVSDLEKSIYEVHLNGEASHLEVSLPKLSGTAYSAGAYKIDVHLSEGYPFEKPSMKFNKRLWHPNIYWETV